MPEYFNFSTEDFQRFKAIFGYDKASSLNKYLIEHGGAHFNMSGRIEAEFWGKASNDDVVVLFMNMLHTPQTHPCPMEIDRAN